MVFVIQKRAGLLTRPCNIKGILVEASPDFVALAAAPSVVVGIGGFLDVLIIPGGLGIVGPGNHVVEHVVGVGFTTQDIVHQCHGLGTGDGLVGAEGAVIVTVDPAHLGSAVDVDLRPVTLGVVELILEGVGIGEEAGGNGGKFRTGDGITGAEGAVVVAGDDAGIDHSRDGVVKPVAGLHIREAAVGGPEVFSRLVGE